MAMDYRLSEKEPLADGIKRVGLSLNQQALDHVHTLVKNDPHEAVHQLRKRFKELRALLRLIRYDLGEEKYKQENHFYRDLGREISEIRDLKAFLESIEMLKNQFHHKLYKNAFSKTEAFLADKIQNMEERMNLRKKLIDINENLKEHSEIIKEWPLKLKNFDVLQKGLKKVYARGYKLNRIVRNNPTADKFHEWRKRSKYLHYQMDILMYIWPEMMNAHELTFHNLTDMTGDDHDLALFIALLEDEVPDTEEVRLLKALANDHRAVLEEKAFELGNKLYYEKPADFVKRIGHYWMAHEKSYPEMYKIPHLNSH